MPQPLLVIFDCDGVLVDSERLSHGVLREMIGEYGIDLTLEETLEHFMGTSTEKCLAILAALIGREAPADFLHRFKERSFQAFATSLEPVQGVPELLRTLEHPFCVASNGPREKMRYTLGHTRLLPFLEGRLFSAQDVARAKPAPDLFLHAAGQMGIAPNRCAVVEDSPTGVEAAKSAGMHVLGYAAMGQHRKLRAAGADVVFEDMAQLRTVMQHSWREA